MGADELASVKRTRCRGQLSPFSGVIDILAPFGLEGILSLVGQGTPAFSVYSFALELFGMDACMPDMSFYAVFETFPGPASISIA